jgi:hypothetical protein
MQTPTTHALESVTEPGDLPRNRGVHGSENKAIAQHGNGSLRRISLVAVSRRRSFDWTDVSPGSPSWLRLARRAKLLATLTLVWLGIEGAVGVVAGILAGSIALVAFGLDSAIEGLASVIVIWRFTGARTISESAERRARHAQPICRCRFIRDGDDARELAKRRNPGAAHNGRSDPR